MSTAKIHLRSDNFNFLKIILNENQINQNVETILNRNTAALLDVLFEFEHFPVVDGRTSW